MEIEYFIPDGDEDWGPVRFQILLSFICRVQAAICISELYCPPMRLTSTVPALFSMVFRVLSQISLNPFLFRISSVPREMDLRELELACEHRAQRGELVKPSVGSIASHSHSNCHSSVYKYASCFALRRSLP